MFQPPGNTNIAMALHSAPLDATVEDRLRDKIIRNNYIEFADLIRNRSTDAVVVTQVGDNGDNESQPFLLPNTRAKEKLSYIQWQKAFYIYTTVWVKAHPQDFVHMIKYADTIRELVVAKSRWYFCDE